MTTKITRYSPDTCTCVIEYTWDDTTTESNRVHTVSNVIQKCPAHNTLSNSQVFNAVIEVENPRKNKTIEKILESGPNSLYDVAQDGTRTFKQGITVSWSWSGTAPNRILTLTITGITLTQNQKNTIQTTLDNFFGSGNVILVNNG